MSSRTVIIGGSGEVGSLFAKHISNLNRAEPSTAIQSDQRGSQKPLVVIDKIAPKNNLEHVEYIRVTSGQALFTGHAQLLKTANTVILALPEDVALDMLPEIVATLGPHALLIDTLSVKGEVCARLTDLCRQRDSLGAPIECISINPMFAPSMGFSGQCVAVIPIRAQARSEAFIKAMQTWGARIEVLDAAMHDQATATLQVATHAAILAFGASLLESSYDARRLMQFAPPPHRALMALLARICAGEPEVYRDIQVSNTLAKASRQRLSDGLKVLEQSVQANDPIVFATLIGEIRQCMEPELEPLTNDCQKMFEALRDRTE